MTDKQFIDLKNKYDTEGITMIEVALVFTELEIALKELGRIRAIVAERNRDSCPH